MSLCDLPSGMRLQLSEKEERLFSLLLEASRRAGTDTVMRVAGGWVRDKLLNLASDDIDIALDNLTGREFAELVNLHLEDQGIETHSIGVMSANAKQSKHLETVAVKILDFSIDFVNLRSETYTASSRIPAVVFGTAQSDAFRRDLTINSLFYNINTRQVEDYTGKGLIHLQTGVIDTPLPPTQTFLDDPLRVLRSIRFASRFNYRLAPHVYSAAKDAEVQRGLMCKISRERVTKELEGMIDSPHPMCAFRLLEELDLLPLVFQAPPSSGASCRERLTASHSEGELLRQSECTQLLEKLFTVLQYGEFGTALSKPERRLLWLSTALLPLRGTSKNKRGREVPLVAEICRLSLRGITSSDISRILSLHENLPSWSALAARPVARLELGRVVRHSGPEWRLGVMLAMVEQLPPLPSHPTGRQQHEWMHESQGLRSKYNKVIEAVHMLDLQDCWSLRPLLDGQQVMQAAGLVKQGPMVGTLSNMLIELQIADPDLDVEKAKDFIKQSAEYIIKV